jgi:hypothetical protein
VGRRGVGKFSANRSGIDSRTNWLWIRPPILPGPLGLPILHARIWLYSVRRPDLSSSAARLDGHTGEQYRYRCRTGISCHFPADDQAGSALRSHHHERSAGGRLLFCGMGTTALRLRHGACRAIFSFGTSALQAQVRDRKHPCGSRRRCGGLLVGTREISEVISSSLSPSSLRSLPSIWVSSRPGHCRRCWRSPCCRLRWRTKRQAEALAEPRSRFL